MPLLIPVVLQCNHCPTSVMAEITFHGSTSFVLNYVDKWVVRQVEGKDDVIQTVVTCPSCSEVRGFAESDTERFRK